MRLPVSARFGPGRKGKWEPYIEAGLYAGFLLSYEEYFKTSYKDYSTTGWIVRQQEVIVRNKTMEDETRVVGPAGRYYQVILLDEGIYRTFDWGAQATLGTRYRISKRLLAGLGLHISYGFGDVERKGELKYSDPYTRQFIQFRGNSFWDYNTPKGTANYVGRQERSATHLFTAGLQLSIQYQL